jgi:hypothetical protein
MGYFQTFNWPGKDGNKNRAFFVECQMEAKNLMKVYFVGHYQASDLSTFIVW